MTKFGQSEVSEEINLPTSLKTPVLTPRNQTIVTRLRPMQLDEAFTNKNDFGQNFLTVAWIFIKDEAKAVGLLLKFLPLLQCLSRKASLILDFLCAGFSFPLCKLFHRENARSKVLFNYPKWTQQSLKKRFRILLGQGIWGPGASLSSCIFGYILNSV